MRRSHLQLLALVLILTGAATGGSSAGDGGGGMTPLDLATLESMTTAVISPDGSFIAAVKTVPRKLFEEPDGRDWTELHLIDVATGVARPFVTGQVTVSDVDWRPDSSAVSFLSQRGGDEHQQLYLIPTDGGEATPILSLATSAESYTWSPDGQRVAVIAARERPDADEALRGYGFDQEVFEEDWQPLRVWIADLDDGSAPRALELPGSAIRVRFSPDGRRLAVAVAPTPLVDDRIMFQTVHVVDSATGEVTATVDHSGKLEAMEWSPDGRLLAMIGASDLHDPAATSLLVAPASGGPARNLTLGFEGSASAFAWLSGRTVLLLADVGVATELYRVDVASGARTPVGLSGGDVVYTSLSVADDGRSAALIGSSPSHPDEVFGMDLEQRYMPVRLTDANPWLAGVRLAPHEVLRTVARDGVELQGILIRPLDPTPDGPAPLVMVVHGGPEGHRRNGWLSRYSAPAQVLAARGFAVFFPNYRGSTGRGVAFSEMGQGDPAGAEFDDLVDAIDHLVALGVADRDRVGVTGGSYGGYATAWLATRHSERVAAGVMFVGISDLISKFGTTDIPQEDVLVHELEYPWDRWRFHLQRSPLYHVENAETPLLIMGGDADPRVSPTQSLELYRALKTLGKAPVRLVRYPGEGHGNRRAASRYDYMLRLLRWFDHYLRGPGGAPPDHRLDYRSPDDGWPADDAG